MSVGRGKSLSGEERYILARNDAEGSAQLLNQSGSFVRRWVMRASRDGSMMAIVQHRVEVIVQRSTGLGDDFRLDLQWC